MKNLFKNIIKLLLGVACLFVTADLYALNLSKHELGILNRVSPYLDEKPQPKVTEILELFLNHENPAVRGLVSIILFKHFGKGYRAAFLDSFTLNAKIHKFKQKKHTLVKLKHIQVVLESLKEPLTKIEDERVRKMFLFFHFRHINLWLEGAAKEKVSMPVFYRISALKAILLDQQNIIELARQADKPTQ
jgi:hypothetical protein